jgi:hypothetical protein
MSEIITVKKLIKWLEEWDGSVNIFDSQFEKSLEDELKLIICDKPHWDNLNEVYDRIEDFGA